MGIMQHLFSSRHERYQKENDSPYPYMMQGRLLQAVIRCAVSAEGIGSEPVV